MTSVSDKFKELDEYLPPTQKYKELKRSGKLLAKVWFSLGCRTMLYQTKDGDFCDMLIVPLMGTLVGPRYPSLSEFINHLWVSVESNRLLLSKIRELGLHQLDELNKSVDVFEAKVNG